MMPFVRQAVDMRAVPDARQRLLIAAERLLLRGGLQSVSLRRIAAEAHAHPALVSYYFGGLTGLLRDLADSNLDLQLQARAQMLRAAADVPEAKQRLAAVIDAYVRPMLYASAYCQECPASAVIRELINSQDTDLRQAMVARISESIQDSTTVLAPLLPQLDTASLVLRLRMLTGASIYLVPQLDELGLFDVAPQDHPAAERSYLELLIFAHGALQAPVPGSI